MTVSLKTTFHDHCRAAVQETIDTARAAMASAQAAANENTKSSAGDKYETGRAMMQIERDKAAERLATAMKLEQVLSEINPEQVHESVALGSLVKTERGYFYLSVPLGKVKMEEGFFWAISPVSPVGRLMMGLRKGESYAFNGQEYELLEVG